MIMTVNDVIKRIESFSSKALNDDEVLEQLADILVEIGNESLDSSKPTGRSVGYCGVVLDEWSIKKECDPFFRKDSVTGQWHSDPRVILIGNLINDLGNLNKLGGQAYMTKTYYMAGKKYHGELRSLEHAWDGIGYWRS